jgi:hypothetical protein
MTTNNIFIVPKPVHATIQASYNYAWVCMAVAFYQGNNRGEDKGWYNDGYKKMER